MCSMAPHNPQVESNQIIMFSEEHVSPCPTPLVPFSASPSMLQQDRINYYIEETPSPFSYSHAFVLSLGL